MAKLLILGNVGVDSSAIYAVQRLPDSTSGMISSLQLWLDNRVGKIPRQEKATDFNSVQAITQWVEKESSLLRIARPVNGQQIWHWAIDESRLVRAEFGDAGDNQTPGKLIFLVRAGVVYDTSVVELPAYESHQLRRLLQGNAP